MDSRVEFANEIIIKINKSFSYWYMPGQQEMMSKPYFDKNQTLDLLEIFRKCDDYSE